MCLGLVAARCGLETTPSCIAQSLLPHVSSGISTHPNLIRAIASNYQYLNVFTLALLLHYSQYHYVKKDIVCSPPHALTYPAMFGAESVLGEFCK